MSHPLRWFFIAIMAEVMPVSTQFDLASHGISRPEKIRWVFPSGVDPATQLKSESLRKFLNKAEVHLEANNITWSYQPIDQATFESWLPFYRTKMTESGFRVIADEAWYKTKVEAGVQIFGLFFHQQGQLVASGVVTYEPQFNALHLNFKATDRLNLSGRSNSSIGALVDYFFLKQAHQQACTIITSGQSRNAFGVYNTLGYLDFKLRLGFQPEPVTEVWESTVPLNELGQVLFYGQQRGETKLFAVTPADTPNWWIATLPTLGDIVII
jgi:hypothetical protein